MAGKKPEVSEWRSRLDKIQKDQKKGSPKKEAAKPATDDS